MSDTKKDKRHSEKSIWQKAKVSKNLKIKAKNKRKVLKDETNPRVLKRLSANEWDTL